MVKESKKIVIIGSGNLATHFANLFVKKGHEILQFVGRNPETLTTLSTKYFTTNTTDLSKINKNADIYILCVSDKEIKNVASKLKLPSKLVLHTSGTANINSLKGVSTKLGVLYPLQTFTANDKVKWSKVPFLIEGNTKIAETELQIFCTSLTKNINIVSSAEREKIHLAAVLVSNFNNHLFSLADDFLQKEKINHFKLLIPLIQQTTKKIKKINPAQAQTGPAQREDQETIKKHLGLLKNYPETIKVYEALSNSILKLKHAKLQRKAD
jgi:predicted short-subunit dehydrogenase-like oxidoreductase (DUF2520 family)